MVRFDGYSLAHLSAEDAAIPIGPTVRRLLGPLERDVSNLYRAVFLDPGDWVRTIRQWAPTADRILEVGCGEGAMTELLRDIYPAAHITAIDVTPRLGRMYRGDRDNVRFIQAPVEDIAAAQPASFDLAVLNDVLHHVPTDLRGSLIQGIRDCLAPGAVFVFKEWVKNGSPIHWFADASDRYLTGDDVSFLSAPEVEGMLQKYFGRVALDEQCRIRPWSNNLAVKVCAPA
jgi:2-polyprenyl-6-hydroxyphenyl methylase/3-demethylubiquinone-9 3-methyltransferase